MNKTDMDERQAIGNVCESQRARREDDEFLMFKMYHDLCDVEWAVISFRFDKGLQEILS